MNTRKEFVHGTVKIMEVGKGVTWFRRDFAFVFREEQGQNGIGGLFEDGAKRSLFREAGGEVPRAGWTGEGMVFVGL